mgnify:FL=1
MILSCQVESVRDAFLVISDVGGTSRNQAARNMAGCALTFISLNEQEFPSIHFYTKSLLSFIMDVEGVNQLCINILHSL